MVARIFYLLEQQGIFLSKSYDFCRETVPAEASDMACLAMVNKTFRSTYMAEALTTELCAVSAGNDNILHSLYTYTYI